MAFTVRDYHDLIAILADHPEWRAELRRLVLSDDLLALPEKTDRLSRVVEELAEAQRRTEQRVAELAEALRQLAEAQRRSEQRLDDLTAAQKTMSDILSGVKGQQLEITFSRKAPAYLGRFLRRTRVVPAEKLSELLEDRLEREDFCEVLLSDVIVRGLLTDRQASTEVWVVVEVSSTVDRNDVLRARQRAEIMRAAGYQTIPAVAGEGLTEGARQEAQQNNVLVLLDGAALFWDEALASLTHP